MKIAIKIMVLMTISALAFLASCQIDEDEMRGDLRGTVSGEINLNFETTNALYENSSKTYGVFRTVYGSMIANNLEYKLILHIKDKKDGTMIYSFSKITDGDIFMEVFDNNTHELQDNYILDKGGSITFTILDDKAIQGSFDALIFNSNSSKSISINNGYLDLKEQLP